MNAFVYGPDNTTRARHVTASASEPSVDSAVAVGDDPGIMNSQNVCSWLRLTGGLVCIALTTAGCGSSPPSNTANQRHSKPQNIAGCTAAATSSARAVTASSAPATDALPTPTLTLRPAPSSGRIVLDNSEASGRVTKIIDVPLGTLVEFDITTPNPPAKIGQAYSLDTSILAPVCSDVGSAETMRAIFRAAARGQTEVVASLLCRQGSCAGVSFVIAVTPR